MTHEREGGREGRTDGRNVCVNQYAPTSKLNFAGGPGAYMDAVLSVWMEKGPGGDRGSTDVATLEELVLAVRRANCGRIAQTLTLTDS